MEHPLHQKLEELSEVIARAIVDWASKQSTMDINPYLLAEGALITAQQFLTAPVEVAVNKGILDAKTKAAVEATQTAADALTEKFLNMSAKSKLANEISIAGTLLAGVQFSNQLIHNINHDIFDNGPLSQTATAATSNEKADAVRQAESVINDFLKGI